MHPIFSSQKSFSAVLLFWLVISTCITLLFVELLHSEQNANFMVDSFTLFTPWYFLLIFFCFPNFYLTQRLRVNNTQLIHIVLYQNLAGIITVGFWLLLGYLWFSQTTQFGIQYGKDIFNKTVITHLLLGIVLYSIWVLIHYTYLAVAEDEEKNSENLQNKLLISQLELKTIKETVHPHFMYNSLNMLANLSQVEPEKVHNLCISISEFLRYSVNYARREWVTVAQEVSHIKSYLDIEQARFGDRLQTELRVDEKCKQLPVIPLLLFPLIENSIKHGIDSSLTQGYIKLDIQQKDDQLLIQVTNSLEPLASKTKGTGLGLSTLKKRIAGYYGKMAELSVQANKSDFIVKIKLPVKSVQSVTN